MFLIVPFQYQRNSKSLIIEYMLKLYILHQNNLLFSMETNAVKENYKEVVSHFKSKLKLPIVLTYSIILILYNWDIIYYLIFQKSEALIKIHYIKNIDNDWYYRIWIPILIAIFYALLFPILQVGINYVFKWFKKENNMLERQEEKDNAEHRFEIQKIISGYQEIESLNNQIGNLINDKEDLNNQINILMKEKEDLQLEKIKLSSENKFKTSEFLFKPPQDITITKLAKQIVEEYKKFTTEKQSCLIDIFKYYQKNEVIEDKDEEFSKITIAPKFAFHILNYLSNYKMVNVFSDRISFIQEYRITALGKKVIDYLLENDFKEF